MREGGKEGRGTYYYPYHGTTARGVLLSLPFAFRLVASSRCVAASLRRCVALRCVALRCVVASLRCVVMERERGSTGRGGVA